MKKVIIVLFVLIFVFLFLIGTVQAKDFIKGLSFKLTGGYGTAKVGDINVYAQDLDSFFSATAEESDLTKEGKFKDLTAGLNFEGEIMVKLFENLGIGVGTEYIRLNNESVVSLTQDEAQIYKGFFRPRITAVPVHLSVYYFYPIISSMKFYLKAGVGYYFGKASVTYRVDQDDPVAGLYWERTESEITDQGFGYHGGFGYEFDIGSNFVFFIEGKGRFCKLKSWKGDSTYANSDEVTTQNSGTMWYYEELDSATGNSYSRIVISEEPPDDPDFTNVREFEGDFSGISFAAGIKIKF